MIQFIRGFYRIENKRTRRENHVYTLLKFLPKTECNNLYRIYGNFNTSLVPHIKTSPDSTIRNKTILGVDNES